eukprot:1150190-Pelagomonas_calceolata.AAC.2
MFAPRALWAAAAAAPVCRCCAAHPPSSPQAPPLTAAPAVAAAAVLALVQPLPPSAWPPLPAVLDQRQAALDGSTEGLHPSAAVAGPHPSQHPQASESDGLEAHHQDFPHNLHHCHCHDLCQTPRVHRTAWQARRM